MISDVLLFLGGEEGVRLGSFVIKGYASLGCHVVYCSGGRIVRGGEGGASLHRCEE